MEQSGWCFLEPQPLWLKRVSVPQSPGALLMDVRKARLQEGNGAGGGSDCRRRQGPAWLLPGWTQAPRFNEAGSLFLLGFSKNT